MNKFKQIKIGWIIVGLLVTVALLGVSEMLRNGSREKQFRFLITETSGPTSFDPLDADATNNLPVARMMYATPLEVSVGDKLTSTILSDFSYNQKTRTITWVVKDSERFESGEVISANDVVLSVLRMAAKRPKFPVIREILGVEEWAKKTKPLDSLPKGIRVDGNVIQITLVKNVDHPLFRFCLEIFGVIPSKCVDRDKNVLSCPRPPESGRYKMGAKSEDSIDFVQRHRGDDGEDRIPGRIRFEYVKPQVLTDKIIALEDAVVAAHKGQYSQSELENLSGKYETRFLPRARFSAFLLNPRSPSFGKQKCRLVFAQALRSAYASLSGPAFQIEGSISPKIVAGHMPIESLEKAFPVEAEDVARCREFIRSSPVRIGFVKGSEETVFNRALAATLDALGQEPTKPTVYDTLQEQFAAYSAGDIDVLRVASGLWPLDPFGDLQMLFAPEMHKTLEYIQDDSYVQSLLSDLRMNIEPSQRVELAKSLNQYLYEQSVFNVTEHISRFYAAKPNVLPQTLPTAITSPAPWQVFHTR